jgi:hypothetical protein
MMLMKTHIYIYISLNINKSILIEPLSSSDAYQFTHVGFQFSRIQDNNEADTVITIFDERNEAWISRELSLKL